MSNFKIGDRVLFRYYRNFPDKEYKVVAIDNKYHIITVKETRTKQTLEVYESDLILRDA